MKVFIFLCVIVAVAVAYPHEVRRNSKRPFRPACPITPPSQPGRQGSQPLGPPGPSAPPKNVTASGAPEPPAQSDPVPSERSTDETQNEKGPVTDQPEQGHPSSDQDLVQESSPATSGTNIEEDDGGESQGSSESDESDESDSDESDGSSEE